MFVSAKPMNLTQFDAFLKGIDWKREGETAFDQYNVRSQITDIGKVRFESSDHVLFDASRTNIDYIEHSGQFLSEEDDGFDVITNTVDESLALAA